MGNIFAMTKRICLQIIRDKRTLALLIIAPLLVLTLVWYIFGAKSYEPKMAAIHAAGSAFASTFKKSDYPRLTPAEARDKLKNEKIDAYVDLKGPIEVHVEGSNPSKTGAALKKVQKTMQTAQVKAAKNMQKAISTQQEALKKQTQVIQQQQEALQKISGRAPSPAKPPATLTTPTPDKNSASTDQHLKITYLHGNKDLNTFDSFGPAMLGIFVFLFIFMIGGVSFLRERTTGTLDRLMASPIKNYQIITGYMAGFGLFVIVQSFILTCYIVYVLNIYNVGSIWYVLIIVFILSFSALSLSILLSTFAKNELQMFQFIPLVIVPQIFLSGLFPIDTLPNWVQAIGKLMPIHYSTDALRNIMIRGAGFNEWWFDGLILALFSLVFITINILFLRKSRAM